MSKLIKRRPQRGFTLIEMMVTVVIVSILATIAIPNYRDFVTRGRITEATTALGDMRSQMEKYYMDNRTYLNAGACAVSAYMTAYNAVASNKFNLSPKVACTANTYTLQADGVGPMAGYTYTIDQQNVKATTGTGAWGKTSASCWVSRKDGTCL
jgi:type IV pilus assembly protein PilE